MYKSRNYWKIFATILIAILTSAFCLYLYVASSLPGELVLLEGKDYTCQFGNPFKYSISADKEGILKINGGETTASGNDVSFSKPVSLSSEKSGRVNLEVRLFGLMTVKVMQVDVVNTKEVAACGNTIGVKLKMDGIMVIGAADVETRDGETAAPSKNSGIKPGAVIHAINGNETDSIDELVEAISNCGGKSVKIRYSLSGKDMEAYLTPVLSAEDNRYHIGLWVKEATAGIGTLTFIDPSTKYFGALGHGITDSDTGSLVPVGSGEIMESEILGVRIGKVGSPGELKGIFDEDSLLGTIAINNESGIYGKIGDISGTIHGIRLYPIAIRNEIQEGPATILSNIDGKEIREFSVEIQKVSKQNLNGSKGMIIKVTDRELLAATGGIVQGMSGSPILQNGKIIGAVTHVLVNDPTRGYGIFIEAMIRNITGNNAT
jgi:stage IV sporulation protein B